MSDTPNFTRKDVTALRDAAEAITDVDKWANPNDEGAAILRSLADRIEALLPPESPSKPEQK